MQSRIAFATPWFSVEEIAAGQPENPFDGPFFRIVAGDGVICLNLTDDDRFVMVRQFRPALQAVTLEFPAGGIDAGESPLQAAEREVLEETGHACRTFVDLGPGRLHLNRFVNVEHFFLGFGATAQPGRRPEPGVETVLIPRSEFRAMVSEGKFEQTAVLAAAALIDIRYDVRLLSDPLERLLERIVPVDAQRLNFS